MKWLSLDTAHTYGSLYESGPWRIVHYVGGFGNYIAKLHRGEQFVAEFAGVDALERAQQHCEGSV